MYLRYQFEASAAVHSPSECGELKIALLAEALLQLTIELTQETKHPNTWNSIIRTAKNRT